MACALVLTMTPSFAWADVQNISLDPSDTQMNEAANTASNVSDEAVDSVLANEASEPTSSVNTSSIVINEDSVDTDTATPPSADPIISLDAVDDPFKVEVSPDEKTAFITLDASVAPQASAVSFPTWSDKNGQDDIVWYQGTLNKEGLWEAKIPIANHKTAGAYIVHAYATRSGAQHMVGAASFDIKAPHADVSFVPQTSEEQKSGNVTIEVTLTDVPSGVTRVQVPFWSSANGQDDIEWLEAHETSPDTWQATTSLMNPRRASGDYIAHVYVTTGNSIYAFAGAKTDAAQVDPVIATADVSQDQKTVTIKAHGGWIDHASAVSFPTWSSQNGQDDIRWYQAGKRDGAWTATVQIADHRSAGIYAVHVYGTMWGQTYMASAISFTIDAPKASVSITQSEDQKKAGSFSVLVEFPADMKAAAPERVQVPVWSTINGQDDIEWLDARKLASGAWQADVTLIHPRRDVGEYQAHVYVTCANRVFSFAGSCSAKVETTPVEIKAECSDDQMHVTITMSGGMFALATAVSVPTWSVLNSQDDIRWYPARRDDGVWTVVVPITNHRTAGDYIAHAYATVCGNQRMVAATSFSIDKPTAASVSTQADNDAGTITVTVSGIVSPSGVSHVQIPTWTASNNQDDIVWHDAQKVSDGVYSACIPAGMHRAEEGTYISHVYVTSGNGVQALVGTAQDSLALSNYLYVTQSGVTRTLWVRNPSTSAGGIQVPTWSATGGQDDIYWYQARNEGGGLWRADIDCRRLLHAGTCYSHVYSGSTFLGGLSFTAREEEVQPIVQFHNIQWAGQPNGYWCGPTSGYMVLRYLGATRAANGEALTIANVARRMGAGPGGVFMNTRDFERGMNSWLGYNAYTTIPHPSYETVREAILDSFRTGYPVVVHTWESAGGAHYNGHGNSTMGHLMVVDGYDRATDSVYIADPWAGVWGNSQQKFWYGSLRDFTNTFIRPQRGIYAHR